MDYLADNALVSVPQAINALSIERELFLASETNLDMPAKATVMKFGGTSLEDALAFERVTHIVRTYENECPVVIVSAMNCMTDALLSSLRAAAEGEKGAALRFIDEHLERHLRVSSSLGATARASMKSLIDGARQEITELLDTVAISRTTSARQQDLIASYGERFSASLLVVVLEEHGLPAAFVDARRCILTDEEHGQARPLLKETWRRTRAELRPLLKAKRIPVLGGFIAATMHGVTTTLGRGSSDYTATLVSAVLGARETQIWTDVNGVLTADPRLIKTARTVPQLSYEEAAELARFGAKVLHPKMIQPAAEQKIPLRICNSRAPEEAGTVICARTKTAMQGAVKAIAYRTGMTTVEITSTPAFVANGFLHAIEGISDRHRVALNIVATSEIGDECAGARYSGFATGWFRRGEKRPRHHLLCGRRLAGELGSAIKLRNTFNEVDSTITWGSTSSHNFVSVLDDDFAGTVIHRLHHAIFENNLGEEKTTRLRG